MKVTYNKQLTALLVIDPYNDFISEGGKIWDRIKGVADANQCIPHMMQDSRISGLTNPTRSDYVLVCLPVTRQPFKNEPRSRR